MDVQQGCLGPEITANPKLDKQKQSFRCTAVKLQSPKGRKEKMSNREWGEGVRSKSAEGVRGKPRGPRESVVLGPVTGEETCTRELLLD